jgi:hypothetical protein
MTGSNFDWTVVVIAHYPRKLSRSGSKEDGLLGQKARIQSTPQKMRMNLFVMGLTSRDVENYF